MDQPCLEDQLCFKLYAVSRLITSKYRPVLESLDLTYPQYLVMLILWKERQISVKELGLRLYLDSGTLTPLLKRLEQKGRIRREKNTADERSLIIRPTAAGEQLRQEATRIPETLGHRLSLETIQQELLKTQLDQLLKRLTIS